MFWHVLLTLFACSGGSEANNPTSPAAPLAAAPVVAPAPAPEAPPQAVGPRVVFLGDSLSAGLGLSVESAFPARLSVLMAERGLPIDVVNAGVSGDTSAGGVRRIDWILSQKPDVVVIELGANDMLRGLPPEDCAANLRILVEKSKTAGAAVLLLGMRANPTLGAEYAAKFDAIYPNLAAEFNVPLVPFLLEGVAGDPALNQPDGIHPTAAGHDKVAASVLPALEAVVRSRPPK